MRASRLSVLLPGLLSAVVSGSVVADPARRVVSLDYCADQYVLGLLPRENILALSPDAEKNFSYFRDRAAGLPNVRPVAEDVIALEPGMIVRSYGGGPQAQQFFERAGIQVVQVPYADDIDGVRDATTAVADELGVAAGGEALVDVMNARLAALDNGKKGLTAMYLSSGGATTGPGTLIDEMLGLAGFDNFETRPGWHAVPLENLAYVEPDVLVTAFFDGSSELTSHWSATRHPVARRQLGDRPTIALPGALTACAGWFLVDAVERLANFR